MSQCENNDNNPNRTSTLTPMPAPTPSPPPPSPDLFQREKMYEMVGLPVQAGPPLTASAAFSTASNAHSTAAAAAAASAAAAAAAASSAAGGGGVGGSSSFTASGRDQFLKTLNWDGPAGDPRERGHYSRWGKRTAKRPFYRETHSLVNCK